MKIIHNQTNINYFSLTRYRPIDMKNVLEFDIISLVAFNVPKSTQITDSGHYIYIIGAKRVRT